MFDSATGHASEEYFDARDQSAASADGGHGSADAQALQAPTQAASSSSTMAQPAAAPFVSRADRHDDAHSSTGYADSAFLSDHPYFTH